MVGAGFASARRQVGQRAVGILGHLLQQALQVRTTGADQAQTMHNLLPIRGSKVRDTLSWSRYLDESVQQNADTEVYFASHNWPVWGNARIREFITKHRDVYRYTHDQTVRLMNAGYTAPEIAAMVELPDSLASYFGARGYYGDLRHNVKAVYQHYLGIYDGNPAHLDPLPPEDVSRRYVEAMGGASKVIAVGRNEAKLDALDADVKIALNDAADQSLRAQFDRGGQRRVLRRERRRPDAPRDGRGRRLAARHDPPTVQPGGPHAPQQPRSPLRSPTSGAPTAISFPHRRRARLTPRGSRCQSRMSRCGGRLRPPR